MTKLKDLYIEELQDLWSANDQMSEVVSAMADKASDSKLADQLLEAGIKVARRTVAKYREALGIAPTHERRKKRSNC